MLRTHRPTLVRTAWVGMVILVLSGLAIAQRPHTETSGRSVYQNTLKSTVWIVMVEHLGGNQVRLMTGSGVLLDSAKRLVLTNYHVVRQAPAVGGDQFATVMFPLFNSKGELVAEKQHYQNLILNQNGGLRGKVVAQEPRADLALIQLDRLPHGATALRLARDGVGPGEDVHSIGNPGASGALWAYTRGSVKSVYQKRYTPRDRDGGRPFEIDARVVETTSPVNAGDSGGPVVNNNGELVAITQGHLAGETVQSISFFIDLSEIKAFLKAKGFGQVVTAPAVTASASESKTVDQPPPDSAADKAARVEKEAATKLMFAEQFVKDRPEIARQRLEEIIQNYPDTKAAQEAKELLTKLKK